MFRAWLVALLAFAGITHPVARADAGTQGVTETEIAIGTHLDLSGPIASWGIPIRNGMEMRVDEINRAGGIFGRKLTLIVEDTGYDPKRAVLATERLIGQHRIFAMVGSLGAPTTAAAMPVALKRGIPYLVPLTAAEFTYRPYHRLKFSFVTPNYDAMRTGVGFLLRDKKAKKVGIIYQNDEYGIGVLSGVEDQLKAAGLSLVRKASYERGAVNFSSQVAKLRSSQAELVALGTTIRETVAIVREARRIGWHPEFLVSGAGYAAEVAELGKEAMEGLYGVGQTPIPYVDTAPPEIRSWMRSYRERYGEEGYIQAISGYLAIDLFALGAANAGPDLTADSLIGGLERIHGYQGKFGSAPVTFRPDDHLGTTQAFVAQIRNGRWHPVTGFLHYRELN